MYIGGLGFIRVWGLRIKDVYRVSAGLPMHEMVWGLGGLGVKDLYRV